MRSKNSMPPQKSTPPKSSKTKATQLEPRWDLLSKDRNEPLALDIEFQNYSRNGGKGCHRIGRIALVNTRGEVVYDTFVNYRVEEGVRIFFPPAIFGVTWRDVQSKNGAQAIVHVEAHLKKIMSGRVIIGHGMRHDISAIDSTVWAITGRTSDTQSIYGRVSLKKCVEKHLPELDFNWHDPTHDARATMALYLRERPYKGRKTFNGFNNDDFPALST